MSLNFIVEKKEGEILNWINQASRLAWFRYGQRYPEIWDGGKWVRVDASSSPPWVSFRLEQESEGLINRVKELVEGYHGAVVWKISAHPRAYNPGVIWRIQPGYVSEAECEAKKNDMSAKEFLEKYQPNLSPVAYDDMNALSEYVRKGLEGFSG